MKTRLQILLSWVLLLAGLSLNAAVPKGGHSVFTQKPEDPEAIYFTPENFGIKADGKMDVTKALQEAIFKVKTEKNFGILFLPEGTYRITRTIQIPASVRLIGYGSKRPVIYLAPKTEGFQDERNYMVWFTGGIPREGQNPPDANAGTFYSAVSNVDFRIGRGNPMAVAVRCHVAQHSFISHVDIYAGDGYAGIWDVGNELEDVRFYGGEYGIKSSRTSPGWPMMVVDTYFEGQRKAAVYSKEVGFAFVGMHVKNVPVAFEMADSLCDRVLIERSLFEHVSDAGVKVSMEGNTFSQVNLVDVDCRDVPVAVAYKQSGKKLPGAGRTYMIRNYSYGLVYENMAAAGEFAEISDIVPSATVPTALSPSLPQLPPMSEWVSVRDYGARGDGETDDIEAFEKAIAENEVVYVPEGWYRLSRTLKMGPKTKLIGLHTYATQFVLKESEPVFSGFGGPVPVVESFQGGDNIFTGIGIYPGANNYRAVGMKWMSGEKSYLNDVKFVGGHGTMRKPDPNRQREPSMYRRTRGMMSTADAPIYAQGLDIAWDSQYWSFWITNGGGGTIKDVWSADTYSAAGIYISDTDTPCRIYATSIEHHVRTALRLFNVRNLKIYCLQFEEEGIEGPDERNVEMSDCEEVEFNNVWMYRTIRAFKPKDIGFRIWNCRRITVRNLHNYTQVLPVIEFPLYDMNRHLPVYAWDFAKLTITGDESGIRKNPVVKWEPVELVRGFELASGATTDSKGNVFFCENRLRKIYKWSAGTGAVTLIADFPWKPFALGTDTKDNLIVIARYDPQPGYLVDGRQETVKVLPDDNPMYSGWGNGGWTVKAYAIDPSDPEDSFTRMPLVKSSTVSGVRRVYHPSSRWRGDFTPVSEAMAEESFVAPDGCTIVPLTFDLFRCSAMFPVQPGQDGPVYVANEMNKTTVGFRVNGDGSLKRKSELCPFGQYCTAMDKAGNIYVADGEIFVFDPSGHETGRIRMPERPISMTVGGSGDLLFITTTQALYAAKIIQ